MKMMQTFVLVAAGAVGGIAFMLACSDDSPANVDAADGTTCDCPPAEPPLAGRIVVVTNDSTAPAMMDGGVGARCPAGATVLGGECVTNGVSAGLLMQSGTAQGAPDAWSCDFRNDTAVPLSITARVTCLVPAE